MKREGGPSATEAMKRKLVGDGVLVDEQESVLGSNKDNLYKDSFADVLILGWHTLGSFFLGRISRGEYLVGKVILGILFTALTLLGETMSMGGSILLFFMVIIGFLNISLIVKRFHDFNQNGWSIFLMLIPLYNIYVGFKLTFMLGDEGINDYGKDPFLHQPEGNTWYIVIVIIGICILSIPTVLTEFMPNRYKLNINPLVDEKSESVKCGLIEKNVLLK